MSIRRMMLFTLGGFFKSIISLFKTRVLSDSGTFEAETNLENQLNALGSDLFNSASLVITPNGVKTSKLYSIKPSDGTGDLTVTRATTATRVNENGNIVNVPANVARIDYSTGQPAILSEPQRTNLVYPSAIATTQVRAVTAQVYTLSFYGTGSVVLSGAFVGVLNGTGANNRVSLTFTSTAGNLTLTVSGSATNWQLEAGPNVTSYIPTTTSTVTRNADVISKSGIDNLIGQTEGTIFVDFIPMVVDSDIIRITEDVSTYRNGFFLLINPQGNLQCIIRANSLFGGNNTIPVNMSNTPRYKVAITYSSGNTKIFVNGQLMITITNVYTFSLPLQRIVMDNALWVGANQTRAINNVCLYKTKLTDAQAIKLTTL